MPKERENLYCILLGMRLEAEGREEISWWQWCESLVPSWEDLTVRVVHIASFHVVARFAFTLIVPWDNASKFAVEDWLLRKTKTSFISSINIHRFPIILVQNFQPLFTSQEHKKIDQILREQNWGCFHFQAQKCLCIFMLLMRLAISFSKSGIPPSASKNTSKLIRDEVARASFS